MRSSILFLIISSFFINSKPVFCQDQNATTIDSINRLIRINDNDEFIKSALVEISDPYSALTNVITNPNEDEGFIKFVERLKSTSDEQRFLFAQIIKGLLNTAMGLEEKGIDRAKIRHLAYADLILEQRSEKKLEITFARVISDFLNRDVELEALVAYLDAIPRFELLRFMNSKLYYYYFDRAKDRILFLFDSKIRRTVSTKTLANVLEDAMNDAVARKSIVTAQMREVLFYEMAVLGFIDVEVKVTLPSLEDRETVPSKQLLEAVKGMRKLVRRK